MTQRPFPSLIEDTPEEAYKWIREVTRTREEDVGNYDKLVTDLEQTAEDAATNDAASITFSNTTSGLVADDVQAAIDEVDADLDTAQTAITAIQAITSVISGKYCVGQLVAATLLTTLSTASTSMTNLTGLQVLITPTSTSSIILLLAGGAAGCSTTTVQQFFQIANGSTAIAVPTTPGNRVACMTSLANISSTNLSNFHVSGTNSPASVAQQTYNVMHCVDTGTGYINRSASDTDSAGYARGTSWLIAIELRPIP